MAEEIQRLINFDTSVLIEHFRKSKKENSFFFKLTQKNFHGFIVSVIVHYEIFKGATEQQIGYWDNLFEDFIILPYTIKINDESLKIHKHLKRIRNSIQLQHLLIAATSTSSNVGLATLNEKHFDNVEGLDLITPSSFEL